MNIWTDFPKIPMPQLLSTIVDNRGKTVPLADNGNHILIATNCIRNENLYPSYDKIRRLSQETYDNWFRAHPIAGDILFVCKGTPGRVCMVPDPVDFCIAQDMVALRVDTNKIYNRFLLAILRSHLIQQQITNTSVGDVIPHFKKQFFDQLLIPTPPMKIQRLIGDWYFDYLLKIENNKKINDNLLSQVMSLYKHIFKESNEERKNCRADEYFSIAIGKTPPRKERDWFSFDSSNVKWVSISDMGNCGVYIFDSSEYLVPEAVKKFNVAVIPENTVLLSFKLTVGRVAITDGIMTTNEAIAHFKTQDTRINPYLYCYLKDYNYQSLGSTSSIATAVNSKIIKAMPFIIPNDTELQKFNDIALPAFETIKNNQLENKRLTELRDSILPKFMSGEVDVSDINL